MSKALLQVGELAMVDRVTTERHGTVSDKRRTSIELQFRCFSRDIVKFESFVRSRVSSDRSHSKDWSIATECSQVFG